ncbi:hypothetical protein [Rosenbergiella epipactidis]|uniref:hypothetical protein n=1 Tax=Rosenbergiella epipactidis TaxID=1544694 RepID=UPI0030C7F13D
MQTGKVTVENNVLANVLAAAEANKKGTIENYLKAQKAVCEGNQAACTQMVKDVAGTGLDFVPIVGDIKGFVEAQTAIDYLAAAIGIIPGAGDVAGKAIKAAETALKKGDVADASRLINRGSSDVSAASSLQGSQLNEYHRQAEKYGKDSIKPLDDGRFRFYGNTTPAKTQGEMAGARLVREWDPSTGKTRTWYETLDHSGNVRSVAPKPVTNEKNHHIFDAGGNYQGRR